MNDIPGGTNPAGAPWPARAWRWALGWLVLGFVVVPAVFVVVWVAQVTIVTLPVAGQDRWLVPLMVVLAGAPAVGSALWLRAVGIRHPGRWPVVVAVSGLAQFALALLARNAADFPDGIEPWFPAVPMCVVLWLLGVVLAVAAKRTVR
ncbi:hypothetical protein ACFXK0_23600 [Nocardia sp. NPDC059177]|uniref:hypothetical protein n=1 Tax=Nocardia sp. NPDC059177 TaxID=3346759 RepID=UPI0036AA2B89